jgi:hypothetical protein
MSRKKPALGLDHKRVYARLSRAMGGYRFSDKDMRNRKESGSIRCLVPIGSVARADA